MTHKTALATRASCEISAAVAKQLALRDRNDFDSPKFISQDGLYRAAGEVAGQDPATPSFCDARFSRDYPVARSDKTEESF